MRVHSTKGPEEPQSTQSILSRIGQWFGSRSVTVKKESPIANITPKNEEPKPTSFFYRLFNWFKREDSTAKKIDALLNTEVSENRPTPGLPLKKRGLESFESRLDKLKLDTIKFLGERDRGITHLSQEKAESYHSRILASEFELKKKFIDVLDEFKGDTALQNNFNFKLVVDRIGKDLVGKQFDIDNELNSRT